MNIRILHKLLPAVALLAFAGNSSLAADYLAEGHDAFLNYDFELASELYAKYAKTLTKRPDKDGEKLLEKYERQLEIAENSLANVQKIEIIDKFNIAADDYVRHIALPSGGNRLLPKDKVPFKNHYNSSDYLFGAASGDVVMWTEVDSLGVSHLYEANRLVDNSWESPHEDPTSLNEGGNIINPYMLTDGVTVYFASDGEDSMGGYDLFVATKDPSTGEFRQPMGLGYPFNSPFNEYMLAIDEENGIGWWVSDRNQTDGEVAVYVFYTNEVRKNYNADEEEDIVSLAKVDDISLTQNPDKDYAAVSGEILKRSRTEVADNDSKIILRLPGGRAVRTAADLKSGSAKRNLSQYVSAETEFNQNCERLSVLRKKYHNAKGKKGASQALINQIKELEKTIEWQRDKLKKMRNNIISAEMESRHNR